MQRSTAETKKASNSRTSYTDGQEKKRSIWAKPSEDIVDADRRLLKKNVSLVSSSAEAYVSRKELRRKMLDTNMLDATVLEGEGQPPQASAGQRFSTSIEGPDGSQSGARRSSDGLLGSSSLGQHSSETPQSRKERHRKKRVKKAAHGNSATDDRHGFAELDTPGASRRSSAGLSMHTASLSSQGTGEAPSMTTPKKNREGNDQNEDIINGTDSKRPTKAVTMSLPEEVALSRKERHRRSREKNMVHENAVGIAPVVEEINATHPASHRSSKVPTTNSSSLNSKEASSPRKKTQKKRQATVVLLNEDTNAAIEGDQPHNKSNIGRDSRPSRKERRRKMREKYMPTESMGTETSEVVERITVQATPTSEDFQRKDLNSTKFSRPRPGRYSQTGADLDEELGSYVLPGAEHVVSLAPHHRHTLSHQSLDYDERFDSGIHDENFGTMLMTAELVQDASVTDIEKRIQEHNQNLAVASVVKERTTQSKRRRLLLLGAGILLLIAIAVGVTVAVLTTSDGGNANNNEADVPVLPQADSFPDLPIDFIQIGQDIDGANANEWLGRPVSVSANGKIAVGGARNAGYVRAWSLQEDEWFPLGEILYGNETHPDDHFGYAVSLSGAGDVLAVGSSVGAYVRIFEMISGSWFQLGQDLKGDGSGVFGESVALSGDGKTLVVGMSSSQSGIARVYGWDDVSWSQLGEDIIGLLPIEPDAPFGQPVALSDDGSILAVGSDRDGSGNGYARCYQLQGDDWVQLGEDLVGQATGDKFGKSVALSSDGTIFAVGAVESDGNGPNSGQVRVYQFVEDTWKQLGSSLFGEAEADEFGRVALSADGAILAVGALYNQGTGQRAGHVRVFQFIEEDWVQVGADIDGEYAFDLSGVSVDISADGATLLIGADGNSENDKQWAGQIRAFKAVTSDGR